MITREEILKNKINDLYKEIEFLNQRNTDLRKKSWINVYDENLQLTKTIDQMRNELIKVGQLADKYFQECLEVHAENTHLKGVLESVETFIGQYAIR